MNKATVATIIVISGLIGYLLMRFSLPAFQVERLIFLGSFSLIALLFMFLHRRQKQKRLMNEQSNPMT